MAGAVAGWVGHVPKPRPRGGHWVAGAGPGAGPAGRSDGLCASREGRRERGQWRAGHPLGWAPAKCGRCCCSCGKSTFYSVLAFR